MQTWAVLIRSTPILYYTVSQKKQDTKLLSTCIFAKYWLIFDIFFTVTLGRKFATKRSLQIQPNLKDVATLPYEILVCKKLQRLTAQQRHTKRARTVKECDRDWRAADKQLWQDRNLTFSTSHSTICGRHGSFLPARRYASVGLCDSDVSVRPSVCPSVTRRYCD